MPLDDSLQDRFSASKDAREAARRSMDPHLQHGDGGGTSGGMDQWIQNVDQQLATLHRDIRSLLLGLIAGFLFLLGSGATAYVLLAKQVQDLSVAQTKLQGEVATQDARINGKIELLDHKIDTIIERLPRPKT